MIKTCTWLSVCILALFLAAPAVDAKVSPEEAAKLTGELTPMGAVQAGNASGTIPPWEGGITEPPAGYQPGKHHPDPYGGDAKLFTITAANMDQYAENLSPGQMAMLKRYPDTWKMHVYPTRRSASYPQWVYDAAVKNATTAELAEGGNGVIHAGESIPFPIPKEGVETIWNHLMRYRAQAVQQYFGQAAPTAGGAYTMVNIDQKILFPYNHKGATVDSINNRLAYFLQIVTAPARLAGELLLVHETLNQVDEPRKAWTYNPGQRRVRRAPNVAYDNPGTASDGQRTSDQLDMFNGAPDRYVWTLKGRKEMYVPYNSYKLHSPNLKHDSILQAGHINPEPLRYELHRVWVTDATLREGTSHVYARRTFHIDEDSWQAVVVDQYDGRDQIWRVSEAHPINYYDMLLVFATLECHYDLQNGRYIVIGLNNEGKVEDFTVELSPEDFTPASVRRMGRR